MARWARGLLQKLLAEASTPNRPTQERAGDLREGGSENSGEAAGMRVLVCGEAKRRSEEMSMSPLEMLKILEWSGFAGCEGMSMGDPVPMHPGGHQACPTCRGLRPEQKYPNCFNKSALGHKPSCELNTILKRGKM